MDIPSTQPAIASRHLRPARVQIVELVLRQVAFATLNFVSPVLLPIHLEEAEPLAAWWAGVLLNHALPPLLAAVGAASEEDNDHAEEEADKGRKQAPDSNAKSCMAARAITVDMVTDDAEEAEVDRKGNQCQNPGEGSDHGTHEGADDAGAAGEQESNEGDSALDWVEHHDVGQGI